MRDANNKYNLGTDVSEVLNYYKHKALINKALGNSGGRIRTYDLRVMSPTSYQTALPRDKFFNQKRKFFANFDKF